jgi:hypothetical protein
MIYTKSETGQQVIKDRSVPLSPRQRSAFILFDGKRSVDNVLAATAGLGVTREDVQYMADQGLLVPRPSAASTPLAAAATTTAPQPAADGAAVAPAPAATSGRSAQQRYQDAYPIATQPTAGLGLRGFRLNLAVEGAGSFEKLLELAPKIRDAVGPEKYASLDKALNG